MTDKPPHMCPFCKSVFRNTLILAEHRAGVPRRCMTPDELVAAGLHRTRVGVWTRGPR